MAPSRTSSKLPCSDACNTFIVQTPIGDLMVTGCDQGLHFINQEDNSDPKNPDPSIPVALTGNELKDELAIAEPILNCVNWLRAFFEYPDQLRQTEMPKLCPNSFSSHGPFTSKVWATLQSQVTFGSTISYGELAHLSGSPRAARAVGNAMGRNPFPLVVPCHRVIKNGGQVGAYSWGKRDHVKKWLLAHERRHSEAFF